MEKQYLRLSPEIWRTIIEFCNNSNPNSPDYRREYFDVLCDKLNPEMKTCRQIDKMTREITLGIQCKKMTIRDELDVTWISAWMDKMQNPEEILRNVKEIAFHQDKSYPTLLSHFEKSVVSSILLDIFSKCPNLEILTWDAKFLIIQSNLSKTIQAKTSLRKIKLYDEGYRRVLLSAIPLGWKDLSVFTPPNYIAMEGYLTETEFDWIKLRKDDGSIAEKISNESIESVLTLDPKEPFGFSVTNKYRKTRTESKISLRSRREAQRDNIKELVGNPGTASWLFNSIKDNLNFVLKRATKSISKQKGKKITDSFKVNLKPPLRVGINKLDITLLRTAIPLWLFGVELYFCFCEYYEEGIESDTKLRFMMQMYKRVGIMDRVHAFSKIREELFSSISFMSAADALRDDQIDENAKLDRLSNGILQVCETLLENVPANDKFEEDVFQVKLYTEIECEVCMMGQNAHVRQIAHNLVVDPELRLSAAKLYSTLKAYQDFDLFPTT